MATRTYVPHTRLTFNGIFGASTGANAPEDIWTFGLNLVPVLTQAQAQTLASAAVDAWYAMTQANGNYFTSNAGLDTVKAAPIGADGKYTDEPVIVIASTGGAARGTASPQPPQVALAVSLHTAGRHGRSGRGRFFLPNVANFLSGTGTIIPSINTGVLVSGAQQMIESINAAASGSKVSVVGTKGTSYPVTEVAVGDVYDTIRTRRNKLPENYVTQPIS